tara:strand:+ start:28970 stop:43993 length:15024 start_codon:yes stop_codon:yes gene_type:complete
MATTTRRTLEQLPQIFQTDKNRRFLNSTLDQLSQPGKLTKVDGYVGSKTSKVFKSTDRYVKESTADRQDYQLEPATTYVDKNGNVEFSCDYLDLINQVKTYGGHTENTTDDINHSRMFQGESYSFAPPVDLDKLVNFREYYWIPNGPAPVLVDLQQPGGVSTFSVVNNARGGYTFNDDGITNPVITLYRGNTYRFEVNAPGHPFWIKTLNSLGTDDGVQGGYVNNNGAEQGTVEFEVPLLTDGSTTHPTVLYYQCQYHQAMHGTIIIRDLDETVVKPNVFAEVVNKKYYQSSNGVKFTNGLKVYFSGDLDPSDPVNRTGKQYYVEGVGKKIRLVDVDTIVNTYSELVTPIGSPWDENGTQEFDTFYWDAQDFYPGKQDYFTINRSSVDNNAWSRLNRWFHRDVIKDTAKYNSDSTSTILPYELDEAFRAKRPIIEFDADLQLHNHGAVAKDPIDLFDIAETDAFSNVKGQTLAFVDGVDLKDGDRVVFSADNDPDVRNKIWVVQYVTFASLDSTVSKKINLVEAEDSSVVQKDQCVLIKKGLNLEGLTYHFDGTNWIYSQQHLAINEAPKFELYDANGVVVSDNDTYSASDFQGSTIFAVNESDNGTFDTVYKKNITYASLGAQSDIQFDNNLASGFFQYADDQGKSLFTFFDTTFYRKNKTLEDFTYGNGWEKYYKTTDQWISDVQIVGDEKELFQIRSFTKAAFINDLTVRVFVNGRRVIEGKDYFLTRSDLDSTVRGDLFVQFFALRKAGDTITIKCKSTQSKNGFGKYEIPFNIERNGLNQRVPLFTLHEISDHVLSITDSHPNYEGIQPGAGNLRDLPVPKTYGERIMTHEGSMPLASFFLKDSKANFVTAMRYVGTEYARWKKSFLKMAVDLPFSGSIKDHVDTIIVEMGKSRTPTFPFYYDDMVGYGRDRSEIVYTIVDPDNEVYAINSVFDTSTLSKRALYVYYSDIYGQERQLVLGRDYIFDTKNSSIVMINPESQNFDIGGRFVIHDYNNTNGSYIPPTPAKLGLAQSSVPTIFADDTYQSLDSTAVRVIKGHDGSLTKTFGDLRDQLLLELELRIYNNLKVQMRDDFIPLTQEPGVYRKATGADSYTREEYNLVMDGEFYDWVGRNGVDYSSHTNYDDGNQFTWNYSQLGNSVDGEKLPGHWRGIYKYFYDTDTPHTTPWEMLGFKEKPTWWENRYGPAPYTRGNTTLWDDLATGHIHKGPRSSSKNLTFRRPGLLNNIPVDDNGNLTAPRDAGTIKGSSTNISQRSGSWKYGDHGPAETAWRRSSEYCFAKTMACALLYPAKFFGETFDVSRLVTNSAGQLVYKSSGRFMEPSKLVFPYIDENGDGSVNRTAGYINIISNYVRAINGNTVNDIQTPVHNLSIRLMYKMAGFTNKTNLKIISGSTSPLSTARSIFIPEENYRIFMNKSTPITTVNYSAVIVQRVEMDDSSAGYEISGYNQAERYFKVLPSKQNNNSTSITVGGATEAFQDWVSGGFYAKDAVVRYINVFYRAKRDIPSSTNFDINFWTNMGSTLPVRGGVRAQLFKDFDPVPEIVPYGKRYRNVEDIFDFIISYGRYLESVGFEFDSMTPDINEPADFLLSGKEFLFWTQQNWRAGTTITLSPSAYELRYKNTSGVVDSLVNQYRPYSVLNQNGLAVATKDISTIRENGVFTVKTNPDSTGLYNITLDIVQKEHALLFDNKTVFNDILLDAAIGFRQPRLFIRGFKTDDWNGDMYSPGFVFDEARVDSWEQYKDYDIGTVVKFQGKNYAVKTKHTSNENFDATKFVFKEEPPKSQLLPNLDYKADQFRDFYELESDNFDAEQQKLAQHLVGYQTRSYLENLDLDETTQYKFYQGFIKEKGTIDAVTKLLNAQVSDTANYSIFEEWAFRVGLFGGHRIQKMLEFVVDESKGAEQVVPVELLDGATNYITGSNSVQVRPDDMYSADTDYVGFPFSTYPETKTLREIFKYEVAGYVREDQVDATVVTSAELIDLDTANFKNGSLIWVGTFKDNPNKPNNNSWDVLRVTETDIRITDYKVVNDTTVTFTTTVPHGLTSKDYVFISGMLPEIDGVYQVKEELDSTFSQKGFSVDWNRPYVPTDPAGGDSSAGLLFTFDSIRIKDTSGVAQATPPLGWKDGDRVFVDNNWEGTPTKWEVLQKQSPYTDQTGQLILRPNGNRSNVKFGSVVVSPSKYLAAASVMVGAPGDANGGKVYIFGRPIGEKSSLQALREITTPIPNKVGAVFGNDDEFGKAIATNDNGTVMVVGAPNSKDIVKIILTGDAGDSTDYILDTFYPIGVTVTGSDTGATGTVMNYREYNTEDSTVIQPVIYVKNNGSTNFAVGEQLVSPDSGVTRIKDIDNADNTAQGSVVIYTLQDNSYQVKDIIASPEGLSNEEFGAGVAVSDDGNYIFVGAPGHNNQRGCIYVYSFKQDFSTEQYDFLTQITPDQAVNGLRFGEIIKTNTNGTTLIVSCPKADNPRGDSTASAGNVFIYARGTNTTSDFKRVQILTEGESDFSTKPIAGNRFGHSMDISADGEYLFVSSVEASDTFENQGKVYVYKIEQTKLLSDGTTTSWTLPFKGSYSDIDDSTTRTDTFWMTVDGEILNPNDGSTSRYYSLDDSSNTVYININDDPIQPEQVVQSNRYVLQQTLIAEVPKANGGFGAFISANADGTEIGIASDKGDQKVFTTFDVRFRGDDSTRSDGSTTTYDFSTTFDKGATRFTTTISETGKVEMFRRYNDFYLKDQDITSLDVKTGDGWGDALSVQEDFVFVGAPGLEIVLNDSTIIDAGLVKEYARVGDLVYGWTTDGYAGSTNVDGSVGTAELVNPYRITKNYLFDKATSKTVQFLDWIDPAKGKLPGAAAQEIKYECPWDPAIYTIGNDTVTVQETRSWGEKQVGELWWDLEDTKFQYYEQFNNNYKKNKWGALFPGTKIKVYEWVESDLLPQNYRTISESTAGPALGVTGIPKYDNTVYVERSKFNNRKGIFETKYYFWVDRPTTVPNAPGRSISAERVARLIESPLTTGYAYVGVTGSNELFYANCRAFLSGTDTVAHIEYKSTDADVDEHAEWQLMAEGDPNSLPPDSLTEKLIDSLIGYDKYAQVVPDRDISESRKYGIETKPERQSMFVNRAGATEAFFIEVNKILAKYKFAQGYDLSKFKRFDPFPSETLKEFNEKVSSFAELSYINTDTVGDKYKVLVTKDETANSFWSLYEWQGFGEDSSGQALGWKRVKTQSFDTRIYWDFKNWYAEGYSDETAPSYTVSTVDKVPTVPAIPGDTVKITRALNGKFELRLKTETGFDTVGLEDGTITINETAYAYSEGAIGYDSGTYDASNYDQEPTVEIRNLVEGVVKDLLVEELGSEWNQLWFTMVRRILSEQKYVDWVLRTGFLKINNTYSTLNTDFEYKNDPIDYVLNYINEVKPLHSQVRDYTVNYSQLETMGMDLTDFDIPPYYDIVQGKIISPRFDTYPAKFSENPYKIFADNYHRYVNEITISDGGAGYTEAPTITFSGGTQNIPNVYFNSELVTNFYSVYHFWVKSDGLPAHAIGENLELVSARAKKHNYQFKIKITPEVRTNKTEAIGYVGVATNGVPFHSAKGNEINTTIDSTTMYKDEWLDRKSAGFIDSSNARMNADENRKYYYLADPGLLYTKSASTHSALIGWAFDGHPIYGAYAYSSALDATSSIKLMKSSYRLKSGTRADGSAYNGTFTDDYEYVDGLGDLDQYNGRTCVTPEFTAGTYAYFVTLDDDLTPEYPYIVGPQFYGVPQSQTYTEQNRYGAFIDVDEVKLDTASQATATAIVSAGEVSRVIVNNTGSGYTQTPTITVSGGGTGVTRTARLYPKLINGKIREFDTTLAFDRIKGTNDLTTKNIVDWEINTAFTTDQNVRFDNRIYKVTSNFTSSNTFDDTNLERWHAADRIFAYYTPGVGMPGLMGDGSSSPESYSQLMSGLEYGGVQVRSITFDTGSNYDIGSGFDAGKYDAGVISDDTDTYADYDTKLEGGKFSTDIGTRPEEIIVQGDEFAGNEFSTYAPEEVVPGITFDTVDIQVYSKPADGGPLVDINTYLGDGSTTTFALSLLPQSDEAIFVYKNNHLLDNIHDSTATHFTIDYPNKTITFTTAPAVNDYIMIQTFSTGGANVINQTTATGDGSTTVFNVAGSISRVGRAYVTVNGAKTTVTISDAGDSSSVNLTFSSAPVANSVIQILLTDTTTKTFNEVKTETFLFDGSTENYVLQSPPSSAPPFHSAAIVTRNNLRLVPPDTAYFTGDGSTRIFDIPTDPAERQNIVQGDIEAHINGIRQQVNADWTYDASTFQVTFSGTPVEGDAIAITTKSGHDYTIDSTSLNLNVDQGGFTAGDVIKVTTFSNHDEMHIETQTFSGVKNTAAFYGANNFAGEVLNVGTGGKTIDSFNTTSKKAVQYQISAVGSDGNTQIETLTVLSDGTNVFLSSLGRVFTDTTKTIEYSASISGSEVSITGTTTSGTADVRFWQTHLDESTVAASGINEAVIAVDMNDSTATVIDSTTNNTNQATYFYYAKGDVDGHESGYVTFHFDGTNANTTHYGILNTTATQFMTFTGAMSGSTAQLKANTDDPTTLLRLYRIALSSTTSTFQDEGTKFFAPQTVDGSGVTLDSIPQGQTTDKYQSAIYYYSAIIGGGGDRETGILTLAANGLTANLNQFGILSSNEPTSASLLTFSASVSGGNAVLSCAETSSGTASITLYRVGYDQALQIEQQESNTYTMSNIISNTNYLWVTYNGERLIQGVDFSVEDDSKTINIPTPRFITDGSSVDRVVVTAISTDKLAPATGFRIFKDILDRYHYKRIAKANITELSSPLLISDTTISVRDGSVLATPSTTYPGVVFIDKERIEYSTKDGNTLSNIRRGTLGTGAKANYPSGTEVVDASTNQTIPNSGDAITTDTYTGDGSTTFFDMTTQPAEADEVTVFVGGIRLRRLNDDSSANYTIGGDSARGITFTSAPASGRTIKIQHKTGRIWYDQGTDPASATNAKGMQNATTVPAKFLLEGESRLPK